MKFIFSLVMLTLLSSCGHVWVVNQTQSGGVIGYSGYDDNADAVPDIKKAIHCANWSPVADNVRSGVQQYNQFVVNEPVVQETTYTDSTGHLIGNSRSASSDGPTYSTVPMATTKYWREFTYACH